MLIFICLFLIAFRPITQVFGAIFGSPDAIQTICSFLIFVFIALAIGAKWKLGWVCMFISIVAMVAVEMLAPYESAVEILTTAFLALIVTIQLKSALNSYTRSIKDFPNWARKLIAIIWCNQQKWRHHCNTAVGPPLFYSSFVVPDAPFPTTSVIKLFHVIFPIIPSCDNPLFAWYPITESLVFGPNTPSNPPVSNPNVFSASCAINTYTPLLPCLVSGYPLATHLLS